SQSTSNPASISQAAAVAALEGDQSCITGMVAAFKERHDFVVDALNGLQGVRCIPSQGAFYAFPDMGGAIDAIGGVRDDVGLADHFLEHAGVALVPGSAFGMPGYMRLSFATGMDNLRDALGRMGEVLGKA
ncbi:MAG TPA: aminotransferase class I/II-fold pyridoxal phosphate-dependent enzyme, partial [Gammaproteobacteria bacterium]|nr:aminotransferase class I/II-fold pyridoxal phosphate-dependent enzyme [Gammaproteobacteria bacterium]